MSDLVVLIERYVRRADRTVERALVALKDGQQERHEELLNVAAGYYAAGQRVGRLVDAA